MAELARWSPAQVTVWRCRRVLTARSWHVHLLVAWWGQEVFTTLPPPRRGILSLVGDGRHTDKRGPKNLLAQKGLSGEHHPWFVGMRFARLSATWDGYRLPVALRLILCREMGRGVVSPPGAKRSIVAGDAAYGSQEKLKLVLKREADAPTRRCGFVCAMARPWKTIAGKALKDLVTHVPRLS